jgi:hypothetical protein
MIRRAASQLPARGTSGAAARERKPWEERCPVCRADIMEEGGTGCCGALVAECDGSIDGVPVDWDAVTDDEDDEFRERVVHHAWYLDTGAPAPSDYTPSAVAGRIPCRCEGRVDAGG